MCGKMCRILLLVMVQLLLQQELHALPIGAPPGSASCFDDFLNRTANASGVYEASYKACAEMGAEARLRYTREKQPGREQMQQDAAVICARMAHCNGMPSDLEFFECNKEAGPANVTDMLSITLNATQALIELDQNSSETERAVQLCNIDAKRVYLDTSKHAHELLSCCLGS